jgi:hypothetical protein
MRTLDDVDHFDTASRGLWEVTINSILSFFSLLVITDVHVKAWDIYFTHSSEILMTLCDVG